jgi:hypothetical protein
MNNKNILLLAIMTVFTPSAFAAATKMTICHKPGTPAEQTKEIPESAWSGHEGHGDTKGACRGTSNNTCDASNVDYDNPLALTLPAMRSGQTSDLITIESECGSKYSGTQYVVFTFAYDNPSTGTKPLLIKNTNGNDLEKLAAGVPAPVPLTFDSQGDATFRLYYEDAGQISLNLGSDTTAGSTTSTGKKVTICHIPPGNPSNAHTITISESAWATHRDKHGDSLGACTTSGTKVSTVVRPYLQLEATSDSGSLNSSTADGAATWKAGKDFHLKVAAVNADMTTSTPNYVPGAINLTATLVNPTAASGGHAGTLTVKGLNNQTLTLTSGNAGASGAITAMFSGSRLSNDGTNDYGLAKYSEVGIIQLTATDSNYFKQAISSNAVTVGRFTPDHFNLSLVGTPSFMDTDGSYTYMDEAFTFDTKPTLTVTAVNASGTTTQNYKNTFWKLSQADLRPLFTDQSGANSSLESVYAENDEGVTLTSNNNGTGTLVIDDVFRYLRRSGLQTPFTARVNASVQTKNPAGAWTNQLADKDGVCYLKDNADTVCDPVSGLAGLQNIGGAHLRYGRLNAESSTGSTASGGCITLFTEYVNAQGVFEQNRDDNSTPLDPAWITVSGLPGITATVGRAQFSQGTNTVCLSAPSDGSSGTATVSVDLSGIDYLRYGGADVLNVKMPYGAQGGGSTAVKRGRIFIRESLDQDE